MRGENGILTILDRPWTKQIRCMKLAYNLIKNTCAFEKIKMMVLRLAFSWVLLSIGAVSVQSFQLLTNKGLSSGQNFPSEATTQKMQEDRRSFLGVAGLAFGILVSPSQASAGIDPSLLKSLPVQGDDSGSATRLRQVESIQKPATDLVDIPFEELPSGVSYREYREGKDEAGV
jgi:hypothetical protein